MTFLPLLKSLLNERSRMLRDLSDCPFGENICWSSPLSSLGEEKLSILRGISMMILSRVLREVDAAPWSNALHQLSSKEKDIAAAAGKLAECQETILVLSKQLKALACPVDAMEFPYKAEKRAERDQRYELDAPWGPRSQSASWASEPENISTANGRGRASEWTGESGLAASDLYKVNVPDSPIVDYLDGRLTMHTYSDTEESSPAGSPVKSTQQRNKFTCFSPGSEFPKPVKTYGGESPTSSSSSSSLASTFFSKSRE